MIKFYTNRELSGRLDINLARWKRWSREFLPPDPLGGMQSGYTRQYNPNEAFKVNLGGHLVADLKFAIPEAKQILKDLDDWLADKGFDFDIQSRAKFDEGVDRLINRYIIFIRREKLLDTNFEFIYTVRGIISNKPVNYKGFEIMEERYVETLVGLRKNKTETFDMDIIRTLYISDVLNNFANKLGLDRAHYQAFNP
ncbi:MAG: hypothetical protein V3S72_12675 [Desulfobacterales bacterium]